MTLAAGHSANFSCPAANRWRPEAPATAQAIIKKLGGRFKGAGNTKLNRSQSMVFIITCNPTLVSAVTFKAFGHLECVTAQEYC